MGVCFILRVNRGEVLETRAVCSTSPKIRYMNKGTKRKVVRISIRVEVAKLVKVKAYVRHLGDKVVKVRSHYRKY